METYLEHCLGLKTGNYRSYESYARHARGKLKELYNELGKLGPSASKQANEALRQSGIPLPGSLHGIRILNGEKPPC